MAKKKSSKSGGGYFWFGLHNQHYSCYYSYHQPHFGYHYQSTEKKHFGYRTQRNSCSTLLDYRLDFHHCQEQTLGIGIRQIEVALV